MNTMKRISFLTIFLLLAPHLATAQSEEDGRLYYKKGLRFEAGDFAIKFNTQLQPRYTYADRDSAREGNPNDTSGVRMRRARLVMSGHVLDKAFSFKLQDDFASDSGGGDLKDAWIQWNGDFTNIRFGQFKVPFVRQFMVSSSKLFFADRGAVSEFFDSDRNLGGMAHKEIGDTGHYYLALFNGDSDGEGANSRPQDTKHTAVFAANFSSPEYGSRGVEGAFGEENGFTAGGSLIYGQGERGDDDVGTLDFDQLELNGDLGYRTNGIDAQAEVVYSSFMPDGGSDIDQIGYYLQAGFICPDTPWGVGGRFGYIDPDNAGGVDDIQEYSVALNYYIDGNRLKVQNQVTFDVVGTQGGEDTEDFRYVFQLAGYF